MKKIILSVILLAAAFVARAQDENITAAVAGERSEWLPSFASVDASGLFDITFIRVPDTEAPKITYDTKGSYTTKFKAEVRDKVLYVNEKIDSRRPERTRVTIYYNDLKSAAISDAVATFEGTLKTDMFDLTVGGSASVTLDLDAKDFWLDLSGKSNITLSGKARYLTLVATTGSVFASKLEVMSAQVNATTGASVTLWVAERLDARTATKGKVSYKGKPSIVRGGSKFMGGDIKAIE